MIQYCQTAPRQLHATVLAVCLLFLYGCSDGSGTGANASRDTALAVYNDPGTGRWEIVAPGALIEECGLDPDMLAMLQA